MDAVLKFECTAVKKAWRARFPHEAADLLVTQIVVSKHHRMRLFPTPRDADAKTGNVPSGTLIDNSIVSPQDVDFYLVSHPGLKGTSRPTCYTTLFDENGFSLAQLETLTFNLCHVYARASRAVSHPAPTFYAHLAAYRARFYVQIDETGKFLFAPLHQRLQTSMYYG